MTKKNKNKAKKGDSVAKGKERELNPYASETSMTAERVNDKATNGVALHSVQETEDDFVHVEVETVNGKDSADGNDDVKVRFADQDEIIDACSTPTLNGPGLAHQAYVQDESMDPTSYEDDQEQSEEDPDKIELFERKDIDWRMVKLYFKKLHELYPNFLRLPISASGSPPQNPDRAMDFTRYGLTKDHPAVKILTTKIPLLPEYRNKGGDSKGKGPATGQGATNPRPHDDFNACGSSSSRRSSNTTAEADFGMFDVEYNKRYFGTGNDNGEGSSKWRDKTYPSQSALPKSVDGPYKALYKVIALLRVLVKHIYAHPNVDPAHLEKTDPISIGFLILKAKTVIKMFDETPLRLINTRTEESLRFVKHVLGTCDLIARSVICEKDDVQHFAISDEKVFFGTYGVNQAYQIRAAVDAVDVLALYR